MTTGNVFSLYSTNYNLLDKLGIVIKSTHLIRIIYVVKKRDINDHKANILILIRTGTK